MEENQRTQTQHQRKIETETHRLLEDSLSPQHTMEMLMNCDKHVDEMKLVGHVASILTAH